MKRTGQFRLLMRLGLALIAMGAPATSARAAAINWLNATSGNWETGARWVGGLTPGNFDTANFNVGGTFNVTFAVAPLSIQGLVVNAGTVTFQSSGGVRTLFTDAAGGNERVFVLGATTTLNYGGTTTNPMNLYTPGGLFVATGGTMVVRSGSAITNLGALEVGNIVNGDLTADTASYTIQGGSSMIQGGDIAVATSGVANVNGAVTVTGANSVLTQFQNAGITVGANSGGFGTLSVASGGTLTTGLGLFTVNRTGLIDVPDADATLNANGDILINGGLMDFEGTLNWAQGRTMAIVSGGEFFYDNDFTTPFDSTINVGDFGSALVTTSTGSDFFINAGADVNIGEQALLSVAGILSVGATTNGTLNVDGLGTEAEALSTGTPSVIGASGGLGIVNFSNDAVGTVAAGINIGNTSTAGTAGFLTIESGADLTGIGNINVAANGGSTTSATLTITGLGSTLTQAATRNLVIGHATTGVATVNVWDEGRLTVGTGGTTTLNPTGTINIDGGIVNLQTLTNNGGRINFRSGSLAYTGNLIVGTGGLLGTNLTLTQDHQLTVGGITTVNAGSLLLIESGAGFTSTSLTNNGQVVLDGIAAAMTVTAAGAGVTNNGLIRGDGRIISTATSSGVTNATNGEIRAEAGKRLLLQGSNGTNAGRMNLQGGTLEFSQPLTNGSAGLITGRGTLIVAPLGGGAGLALTNQGNIALSSGISDVFGDVSNNTGNAARGITITGNSDVTFWDDMANVAPSLFKVTPGSSVTFLGSYSGGAIGGGGSMNFDGDINPGASPAAITLDGNVRLGSTARLNIELGGTTAGAQHDQVNVTQQLALDGTLRVTLIDGFVPALGDTFIILNWGTLSGQFANIELDALAGARALGTGQLYGSGSISVVSILAGDFNQDGALTTADIPAMLAALTNLNSYSTTNSLSAANLLAIGDLNSDNFVTNTDIQSLLTALGGGAVANVPEPASLFLLAAGTSLLFLARRRS